MNTFKQTTTTEPVVVELNSDGFVRVYGSKQVNAKVVIRPHVTTQEQGRQVEELIDTILPKNFTAVYYPGMVRAWGQVERITPTQLAARVGMVELFDRLKSKPLNRQTKHLLLDILAGGCR
ncbi:MAG: hypothetical protein ACK528_08030 [Alphaproteobacteria bacterium]|jgi:hypothetical protein